MTLLGTLVCVATAFAALLVVQLGFLTAQMPQDMGVVA
jgi:hypothetical protein